MMNEVAFKNERYESITWHNSRDSYVCHVLAKTFDVVSSKEGHIVEASIFFKDEGKYKVSLDFDPKNSPNKEYWEWRKDVEEGVDGEEYDSEEDALKAIMNTAYSYTNRFKNW